MTNWKTRIDLRDVWGKRNGECGPEEWTDKTVHELAKEIARRIGCKFADQMITGNNWDPHLTEIHDWFVSIPTLAQHRSLLGRMIEDEGVSDDEICEISNNTPMKEFNDCMSLFYDWCDSNLVWVEK